MVVFPNSKINLGLRIIKKRNDGYHDLETVFYPLPLTDVLEVIKTNSDTSFTMSGNEIDTKSDQNLCWKAFQLLKKDFPQISTIKIHLHKAIPIGGGLGGGSSDGAFSLMILNRKFNLGLSTEKLIDYALQLGSDCPFFIINHPCLATGRGEFLQKISLDLSQYSMLIVNPGIHINTAWAFSRCGPSGEGGSIKRIIEKSPDQWRGQLENDFEEAVFEEYPELNKIKKTMYESGAVYASMTGSGSTIYGLFSKNQAPDLFSDKGYFVKKLNL